MNVLPSPNEMAKMSDIDALYREILKYLEQIFAQMREQAIKEKQLEEGLMGQAVNTKVKNSFTTLRNRIAKLHDALKESPNVRAKIYNEIQNKINQNKEFAEKITMGNAAAANLSMNEFNRNQNRNRNLNTMNQLNQNQNTNKNVSFNFQSMMEEEPRIQEDDVRKLREVLAGIEALFRSNAPNVLTAKMNRKATQLQQDRQDVENLLNQLNIDLSLPVEAPTDITLREFLEDAYQTIDELYEKKAFPKAVADKLRGMRAGIRWAIRRMDTPPQNLNMNRNQLNQQMMPRNTNQNQNQAYPPQMATSFEEQAPRLPNQPNQNQPMNFTPQQPNFLNQRNNQRNNQQNNQRNNQQNNQRNNQQNNQRNNQKNTFNTPSFQASNSIFPQPIPLNQQQPQPMPYQQQPMPQQFQGGQKRKRSTTHKKK